MSDMESLTFKRTDALAREAGLHLNVLQVGSKTQQLSFVNRGNGITMLFRAFDMMEFDNVVSVPLKPDTYVDINCVYSGQHCTSRKHKDFIEFTRKYYSDSE